MNAIVLFSGGLDSAVVAYHVKSLNPDKLIFLFFDYGQRSLAEEEFCVESIASKLNADFKKVDLKWLGKISTAMLNKEVDIPITTQDDMTNIDREKDDITNWWVPCRNAIFLLTALAHAESEYLSKKERFDVYIGIKNEGSVPMKDTTPKFLQKVNELAEEATNDGGYKLIAPFISDDKVEVVKKGELLNVPWGLTFSCYMGRGFKNNIPVHCGVCSNCMQRKKAFYWANIDDVSLYEK